MSQGEPVGADDPIVLPGRAPALAALRDAIDAPAHCLVRGEAGIGKTALLRLAVLNVDAVVVRGVAALSSSSYAPLRAAVPRLELTGGAGCVAARLLAWLGTDKPFVVDDLHWCDTDTLEVLAELAYLRPYVGATRPDAGPALALVEQLVDAGTVINLAPLGAGGARRLARHWRPLAPDVDVARAVDVAAGNPLTLFVATTGARPGSTATEASQHAVARLSGGATRVLATAALAGRDVAATSDERAELLRFGLATESVGGRVRPRHDLFAQAAIDALAPDVLADVHRELASEEGADLDRARHLLAAGETADAAAAASRAASGAPTVSARAEALRIVAECSPPGGDEAFRGAAEALCLAGRYREALDLLDRLSTLMPHDHLLRARAHWAITESRDARAAIAAGLADTHVVPADAAELLSLDSRIRTREEWDLAGGMEAAQRAVALAATATGESAGPARVAAFSALGLAALMAGNQAWVAALEMAGALAKRESDVHNAVTVYDSMIFGQLLSGDPRRCRALVADVIGFTEGVSTAWNRYFRATGLLVALHVEGDHREVLREVVPLEGQQLSLRTQEMLRTVHAMALVDEGHELDAIGVASDAVERASDASARASALWSLAEAQFAAGLFEEAARSADECGGLPVGGFPGAVNAALAGIRARSELGWPIDDGMLDAASSGFPNLQPAHTEASALTTADAAAAAMLFRQAADGWTGVSSRSALRCRWSAADALARAGDRTAAVDLLAAIDEGAPAWLQRRADATARAVGMRSRRPRGAVRQEVMLRVARGQTTKQISRALAVSPSTVETHVRSAIEACGASTRLQAAIEFLASAGAADHVITMLSTPTGYRCSNVLRAVGQDSIALDDLPAVPWRLDGRVVHGEVQQPDQVAQVALARIRGARLDVVVCGDSGVAAELIDTLERTGGVRIVSGGGRVLDAADVELLTLLAAGATIRELGAQLGYSTRTVQRRLAALRCAFAVATNREVVVAAGVR